MTAGLRMMEEARPPSFARTNQGLDMELLSFDDTFGDSTAFRIKWEDANGASTWTTNSTFGADDTNGATNAYDRRLRTFTLI
jgi:hypothetical protein